MNDDDIAPKLRTPAVSPPKPLPHPQDPGEVRAQLARQLSKPVRSSNRPAAGPRPEPPTKWPQALRTSRFGTWR